MSDPVLALTSATLRFDERTLWRGLDLEIAAGEFIAVLGPNGTGKTSLLKVALGEVPLTSGSVSLLGRDVARGSRDIGYIPQQKPFAHGTPLRARDLVALGVDGHRWGLPLVSAAVRRRVDEVLEAVDARDFADVPVSMLSGGEQQRVRVGQAIASHPRLLLCDEPLLSLDLHHQKRVSELIDRQRRESNSAVVFVTHDINPVLPFVDRVVYLVGGMFRVGTPDEVLNSSVLSAMYETPVEVIHTRGRIAVLGAPEAFGVHDHLEHHGHEVVG